MPKSKAEMMARLREERRAKGLKRIELWVRPEDEEDVKTFALSLEMMADQIEMERK